MSAEVTIPSYFPDGLQTTKSYVLVSALNSSSRCSGSELWTIETGSKAICSTMIRSEERRVGKECKSWRVRGGSSRRRHTRSKRDWSSDVCSSDLRLIHKHRVHVRGGDHPLIFSRRVADNKIVCAGQRAQLQQSLQRIGTVDDRNRIQGYLFDHD